LVSPVKVLLIENSHPSLEVPGKGASPPTERERDVLFQDPFFICLSESLVNEPPSTFSSGALIERDGHL
jgi:hypothetical protein